MAAPSHDRSALLVGLTKWAYGDKTNFCKIAHINLSGVINEKSPTFAAFRTAVPESMVKLEDLMRSGEYSLSRGVSRRVQEKEPLRLTNGGVVRRLPDFDLATWNEFENTLPAACSRGLRKPIEFPIWESNSCALDAQVAIAIALGIGLGQVDAIPFETWRELSPEHVAFRMLLQTPIHEHSWALLGAGLMRTLKSQLHDNANISFRINHMSDCNEIGIPLMQGFRCLSYSCKEVLRCCDDKIIFKREGSFCRMNHDLTLQHDGGPLYPGKTLCQVFCEQMFGTWDIRTQSSDNDPNISPAGGLRTPYPKCTVGPDRCRQLYRQETVVFDRMPPILMVVFQNGTPARMEERDYFADLTLRYTVVREVAGRNGAVELQERVVTGTWEVRAITVLEHLHYTARVKGVPGYGAGVQRLDGMSNRGKPQPCQSWTSGLDKDAQILTLYYVIKTREEHVR